MKILSVKGGSGSVDSFGQSGSAALVRTVPCGS